MINTGKNVVVKWNENKTKSRDIEDFSQNSSASFILRSYHEDQEAFKQLVNSTCINACEEHNSLQGWSSRI